MSTEQNGSKATTPSPERLGSAELDALNDLYLASSLLRIRIKHCCQSITLFSDWERHTSAMRKAETLLQNTGRHLRPDQKEGE